MADYISQFTGAEIDSRLRKAGTAVQPADLESKQDTLVSGENIKTVNGQSIVGSGNIQTQAGDTDAVKYVAQTLTDAQKQQARANIGAYQKPSSGIPASDLASGVIPDISGKQDTIQDLSTIRSGATLGSTSVQPVDIENMVEAEPIGSIIPPVNPSEFSTKEEVSQLRQEVTADISQLEAKAVEKAQGKNMFDGAISVDGYRFNWNGTLTQSGANAVSDFIKVDASTQYCYSSDSSTYPPMMNGHYLAYYDADKTYISTEQNTGTNVMAFTTPSNCAYIKTTIYKDALSHKIQLEKGSQRTGYLPYTPIGGYSTETYPDNSVPGTALSNNSVTGGKIADNGIPEEKTTFADIFRDVNILPLGGWESGYYNTDGTQGTSATMCRKKVQIIGAGVYKFYVYRAFFGSGAKTIPFFDEAGNYVKAITGALDSETGDVVIASITVTESDVQQGCASFGYSYFGNNAVPTYPINRLMVVKDIEYPSTFIPYLSFTRIKGTLPLYGKTVVFDGDSICAGLNSAQGVFENGWAGRIGPMNSMDWHNVGVSGGVITQGLPVSHILSSYIDTIHTNYPDLDFLILEGGTNDADRLFNQSKEGTMSETDFSGSYDATTFIGAMETLLYKAQSYYPNTKVGFIVAQKMGRALNADNNPDPYVANRRHFFDLAIQVCKKWGVPYIDLWEDGYLNPNVSSFYDKNKTAEQNRAEGKAYYDGQHLTAVGYDVISPKIEAWMKTL